MTEKTFSSQTAATRAARKAGIAPENLSVYQIEGGKWTYVELPPEPAFTDGSEPLLDTAPFPGDTFEATPEELAAQRVRTSVLDADEDDVPEFIRKSLAKVAAAPIAKKADESKEDGETTPSKVTKVKAAEPKPVKEPRADLDVTPAQRKLLDCLRSAGASGVTHAQLKSTLGWKSECLVALKTACARAGVGLIQKKEGRETRYYAADVTPAAN